MMGKSDASHPTHLEVFLNHRPLLFTIAYEILGSATDSDDVLQESYLRWSDVDLGRLIDPKAYLATIVTRQALNAARTDQRRREDYVGPWLPEPIVIDDHDPADDLVLSEAVSTAMLVVLQSLGPDERAVFVLREVFGFPHDEIADIVGKTSAAVRQIAHRARDHVHARGPTFAVTDTTAVTQAFLAAAATGDLAGLMSVLAPDVVCTTDSNGKASAARRPVRGADAVARFILGLVRIGAGRDMRTEQIVVNGLAGFRAWLTDDPGGVYWFDVAEGAIRQIYVMRNPDKLTGLDVPRVIARH